MMIIFAEIALRAVKIAPPIQLALNALTTTFWEKHHHNQKNLHPHHHHHPQTSNAMPVLHSVRPVLTIRMLKMLFVLNAMRDLSHLAMEKNVF